MALQTISVVGAGVMGRQIGLHAALHGFSVTVADASADALAAAERWCADYIAGRVDKKKLDEQDARRALDAIIWSASIEDAVRGADLVIEAIVEKLEAKRGLVGNLSRWAPAGAVLASNSSYIPSSSFLDVVEHPGRLANLHFFNPALRMELVEIVRGEHTDPGTLEQLKAFVDAIAKTYIVVNKEIEGFVVNRMLRAAQNEGVYLLRNGVASFEDIDKGVEKGLNWPLGPFRMMDLTGLDLNYYNRTEKYPVTGDYNDEPFEELEIRFKRGDYGRKTGKGWYDYTK